MEDSPLANQVHQLWLEAMFAGDFEAAWQQTDRLELPRRRGELLAPPGSYLRWNGEPLNGRRVLIRCLHGLGDSLQFARYLPEVNRIARSTVTLVQPELLSLFATTPAFGLVMNGWTGAPTRPHDVELEVMELAYLFRSRPDSLPHPPYFNLQGIGAVPSCADNRQVGHSRIGLLWSSSAWNPSRSIPLRCFRDAEWHKTPEVTFYSLQRDVAPDDLDSFPFGQVHRDTTSILDLAAMMLELDLIITVDTMAAHLAGALSRPVWLLLQHTADWRWQRSCSDSPWYPTMRIFRQPTPGDWLSVATEVAAELRAFTANGQLEVLP